MADHADGKTTKCDKDWWTSSEAYDRAEEKYGLPRAGQSADDWEHGRNRRWTLEENERQQQWRDEEERQVQ